MPHQARTLEFQRATSTNDIAKALERSGAPHGATIWAHAQTKGRGRLDRNWVTHEGSLCFSIILRPHLSISRAHLLLMAINAGILKYFEEANIFLQIKWPNDIWRNGKKLGGILIEMQRVDSHIRSAVVGIGLNLFPPPNGWPKHLPNPGAIYASKDQILLTRATLDGITQSILHQISHMEAHAHQKLTFNMHRIKSATMGKKVSYGQRKIGTALKIDKQYRLVIENPKGTLELITTGDVGLLPAHIHSL